MEFVKPSPNSYTIYSKTGCPYCVKAKALLENLTPPTYIVDCDEYLKQHKEEFLDFVKRLADGVEHRTFPVVFYEGKFVGGYKETQEFHSKKVAFSDLDNMEF